MTHPLPGPDDSATRCLAVPFRDHGRPFAFWRVGNGKRVYMKDRRGFHLTGWFDLYKVARPGGFAGEPSAVHACGLSAARPPAALASSRHWGHLLPLAEAKPPRRSVPAQPAAAGLRILLTRMGKKWRALEDSNLRPSDS
jgi:hypothetical protein